MESGSSSSRMTRRHTDGAEKSLLLLDEPVALLCIAAAFAAAIVVVVAAIVAVVTGKRTTLDQVEGLLRLRSWRDGGGGEEHLDGVHQRAVAAPQSGEAALALLVGLGVTRVGVVRATPAELASRAEPETVHPNIGKWGDMGKEEHCGFWVC